MNARRDHQTLLLAEDLQACAPAAGRLNIECRRGTLTVLTGPSPVETTAWLETLAGQRQAASGRLRIQDFDTSDNTDQRTLCRLAGYVDARAPLVSTLDVHMNVMLPRLYHLRETHAAARRFSDRLLDRLGYAGQRDVPPVRLSPLQHVQALLARALALEPPLLFVDEPFALETVACWRQLSGLVDSLVRDDGICIVLVTRNVAFAAGHADQLVHVDGQHTGVHDSWTGFAHAPASSAFLERLPFNTNAERT